MSHSRKEKAVRKISSRDIFDSESSYQALQQAERMIGAFLHSQTPSPSPPKDPNEKSLSMLPFIPMQTEKSIVDHSHSHTLSLPQINEAKVLLSELQLFFQALRIVINFHKLRLKKKRRVYQSMTRIYNVVKREYFQMKRMLQEEIDEFDANNDKISTLLQCESDSK